MLEFLKEESLTLNVNSELWTKPIGMRGRAKWGKSVDNIYMARALLSKTVAIRDIGYT